MIRGYAEDRQDGESKQSEKEQENDRKAQTRGRFSYFQQMKCTLQTHSMQARQMHVFQEKSKKTTKHLVETRVWCFHSAEMREEVKKREKRKRGKTEKQRWDNGSRGGEERGMSGRNDQLAVVFLLISELTELDQVLHQ